ncbi:MAG: transcriptional repressor [Candidatus Saccharibacteria bacterium]|nr:transcriptional repressor [Candidatus Saccharibacteria bacterium]
MISNTTSQRQTKYCEQIVQTLKLRGHATNAELLSSLRKSFPDLSATTVHRATTRLASRGTIAIAPSNKDGSMQYDANTTPHDHFQCTNCGLLKDANIKEKITPILESSIFDCSISGQLTINGTCKKCMKGKM